MARAFLRKSHRRGCNTPNNFADTFRGDLTDGYITVHLARVIRLILDTETYPCPRAIAP